MKKKYRPRSLTAVTLLLAALTLIVWLAGMYCVTAVTAEFAAERYIEDHADRAESITNYDLRYSMDVEDNYKYANYRDSLFWGAVSRGLFSSGDPIIEGDSHFLERRQAEYEFAATAVYDAQGNCLARSWDDFFYFEYLTEEQWADSDVDSHNNARALFDRELLTDPELLKYGCRVGDARAMRFTGAFDGVELRPVKIEYIDDDDFSVALHSNNITHYSISGVVQEYDIPWKVLYEDPAAASDEDITVLYSESFNTCLNPASPPLYFEGERYDSLVPLMEELGPGLAAGNKNLRRYERGGLVLVSAVYCETYYRGEEREETFLSPYYYGDAVVYENEADRPELEFYLVSAVYCQPWLTALGELRNVYIVTAILALILVLWSRSVIKRNLILPMTMLGSAMLNERETIVQRESEKWAWRESVALEDGFFRYTDRIRWQKNEITRLNTALEYAKTAEQNRRQMTSNIAHELKTPLAVIHSYAEGLKDRIAEDKRDRYIDVILSEAERTDAMVLEMLDLSRLEAGRVKLSRDEFSLTELARSVFEKLELSARAKQLQIDFSFPEELSVTADESRIAQVIENLAVNAIKYTPVGGHIAVKLKDVRTGRLFAIENDSEPLSAEALGKVWESFYRVDEARSGGGAGLGLAIAKSIVELHGGKCFARNTSSGVEFGFTI